MGTDAELLAAVGAGVWTPASSPNTAAWFAAYKETAYSDNDPADTITDFSGKGLNLDGTGHAPVFKTNIVNGKPVFRFSGAQYLIAALASDWKFLSDGTDFYVAMVFSTFSADPDAFFQLLDTGGNSALTTGFAMSYDDRRAGSRNDKIFQSITNGTTNKILISIASANGAFPAQTWASLASDFVYPRAGNDMIVTVDEVVIQTADTINLPFDTGNPAAPLNVGRDTTGASHAIIELAELVFMKTPTEKEKTNLEAYIAREYTP